MVIILSLVPIGLIGSFGSFYFLIGHITDEKNRMQFIHCYPALSNYLIRIHPARLTKWLQGFFR